MKTRIAKRRTDADAKVLTSKVKELCSKGVELCTKARDMLVEVARKHRFLILVIKIILKLRGFFLMITGGHILRNLVIGIILKSIPRLVYMLSHFLPMCGPGRVGRTLYKVIVSLIRISSSIQSIASTLRDMSAMSILENVQALAQQRT